MSAPPGWHRQDDGRERYWDGQRWTDAFRDDEQPANAPPPEQPRPGGESRTKPPVPMWRRPWVLIAAGVVVLFWALSNMSGSSNLIREVRAAWAETYAGVGSWPSFALTDDNGADNVTVEAQLQDTPQGREEAMGLCRAVSSLGDQVTSEWRRTYVTAGPRGKFLAECRPAR